MVVGVGVVVGVAVVVVVGVSLVAAVVVSVEVGFEATGADSDTVGVVFFSILGSDLHPKEKRVSTRSTPEKDNLDACIVGKTF